MRLALIEQVGRVLDIDALDPHAFAREQVAACLLLRLHECIDLWTSHLGGAVE